METVGANRGCKTKTTLRIVNNECFLRSARVFIACFRAHYTMTLRNMRLPSETFFVSQPLFWQKDVAESGEARKVTRSLVTVERTSQEGLHVDVGH